MPRDASLPPPFVVLALPRSRTAWLSHFLTAGGEFLIGHDIIVECDSLQEFTTSFENGLVGTVETGAVLGWRLLRHQLPQVKLVTLHRPLGEIIASLRKFGIAADLAELESREAMLQACAAAPGVESLRSADLSDSACCQWLFQHLLAQPLPPEWLAKLLGLNIQIDMLARSKRLWQRHETLERLKAEVTAATTKLESPNWMI